MWLQLLCSALFRAPSIDAGGGVALRLLAKQTLGRRERYCIEYRHASALWLRATMQYEGGTRWSVEAHSAMNPRRRLELGGPDHVFALALGNEGKEDAIAAAAPGWPAGVLDPLRRRRMAGAAGWVAFDAEWFLARLASSSFDEPVLLPGAAAKLGLAGLDWAQEVAQRVTTVGSNRTLLAHSYSKHAHCAPAIVRLLWGAIVWTSLDACHCIAWHHRTSHLISSHPILTLLSPPFPTSTPVRHYSSVRPYRRLWQHIRRAAAARRACRGAFAARTQPRVLPSPCHPQTPLRCR